MENFKENLAQNWVYCAQKNLFVMIIFGFYICEHNQKMKKIEKFGKSKNHRSEVPAYGKYVSRHVFFFGAVLLRARRACTDARYVSGATGQLRAGSSTRKR